MAKRKEIDGKKLIQMVKDEVKQTEIMKEFGFKTGTQLKIAYANALMQTGEIPKIKGSERGNKKRPVVMKATVNKRNSISISKKIIENMGFKVGEAFDIKKIASGIQLKKIVNGSKEK
jgi:hypothetical protein